jgi:hypothetical protein
MTGSIKITQLPAAATLTGTEQLPTVQGGITKRTNINDIALLVENSITANGELRVSRVDNISEGGRLILSRASDNADGYFWQTFGSGSTPVFRVVKAFGTPAQIFTITDSGAVTVTGPLTLPASNPTDPNHAARKTYVDAGDVWVKIADTAVTNSTIIDVTGFSLQDYRQVRLLLLGARPSSTVGSGSTTLQLYRNGTLVTTGYEWQRLTGSGSTASAAVAVSVANIEMTFSGIVAAPFFARVDILQPTSTDNPLFYAEVFYSTTSTAYVNIVSGRAAGGSSWTDGFRITAPVAFQNNIGRVVVMGLKP